MRGLSMEFPLTVPVLIERANNIFGAVEIVTRRPDRSVARSNWNGVYRRARRLSNALARMGLRSSDRVATLMWNQGEHLEAYFGIPQAGGVLHTLNPRLHPDELAFIVNHAEDRFLIVAEVLLPIYEKFRDRVKFERVVVVPSPGATVPAGCDNYEDLLAAESEDAEPLVLDERDAAAMCYTSGTTGRAKGVLYSHRALVLHSLNCCGIDSFAISMRDTVMPMASLFHANGWGLPFTAALAGAKLVLPGPLADPEGMLDLMQNERVTVAAGVPTVWFGVLDALDKTPGKWKFSWPVRLLVGGAAPSETQMRGFDRHGITVQSLYGMTETAPHATSSTLRRQMDGWDADRKYEQRLKQGIPTALLEARVIRLDGTVAPHDGTSIGEIELRGPWVASAYYNSPQQADRWSPDGWLRSGDMGHMDEYGFIKLVDRSKDVIKSGGEWISSVDLENTLMGHPAVKEAAVIGITHPKWQERPLAVVVLNEGAQATPEDLRNFLSARFAKWQLPDAFVFTREIPRTAVGKFLKSALRQQFAEWKWDE